MVKSRQYHSALVLTVAASHADIALQLDGLVLRFTRKEKTCQTAPINKYFCSGERTAILCQNRRIRHQLLGTIYGLVQPISGCVIKRGIVGWPLGLKGGIDGKLTLQQNMNFLGALYADRLAPLNLDRFLSMFLGSIGLSPHERLKDLRSRDQKIFYMVASLAFSFDIFLVPSARFLMGDDKDMLIQYFRTTFMARVEKRTLIAASSNKNFLKEFCDRGLAISPSGQQIFEGSLEDCFSWMKSSSTQSDATDDDDDDVVDDSTFSLDLSNDDEKSEFLEII